MTLRFVLVHGGWHGGWAWRPVRAALESAGHQVTSPDLPGFGGADDPTGVTLRDCVNALVQHVQHRDLRDVVLVGHSWGGIVAGGAAPALRDRLRHLVFLSAYLPRVGESMLDLLPPNRVDAYARLAKQSTTNSVLPPLAAFQERFMNDAPRHLSALMHGLLQPQPWRTWADPLAADMDPHGLDVPRSYLVPEHDIAAGAGAASWSGRYGATFQGRITPLPGAHEVMFTQPGATAAALQATLA